MLAFQNVFVGIAKTVNTIFSVNLNKISTDLYLNEKNCCENLIFVYSVKHFLGEAPLNERHGKSVLRGSASVMFQCKLFDSGLNFDGQKL